MQLCQRDHIFRCAHCATRRSMDWQSRAQSRSCATGFGTERLSRTLACICRLNSLCGTCSRMVGSGSARMRRTGLACERSLQSHELLRARLSAGELAAERRPQWLWRIFLSLTRCSAFARFYLSWYNTGATRAYPDAAVSLRHLKAAPDTACSRRCDAALPGSVASFLSDDAVTALVKATLDAV